jgi:UDP-N-acetylglucosamine--N-acetylmuramyl-(pentapeptide) pyrophosphoryl-undecaprenol N-acetylglucosamine transferase
MRILMTGGGTAGHVNPALAIAATIQEKQPDAEIAFVASALPTDKAVDLVPRAGYTLETVHIRGAVRPLWKPANLKLPFVMAKSLGEAEDIVKTFRPDLIVGTGGYACWPTCRTGIKKGIPTVLHESNALPGLAVRKLKSRADLVLVNFSETLERLGLSEGGSRPQAARVGNPIMPGFCQISREEARARLGLSPTDLYVLAFGGSLGAENLNDATVKLASALTESPRVRLTLAAGKRDYPRVRADWAASPAGNCPRMELLEYIYDMPDRMAAADLVISRAGAMSISELALTGKASVLIPSPNVAENHQFKNAMALVKEGAGICVEESTLPDGALTKTVTDLLESPQRREDMGQRILGFACPDANERIYERLMGLLR